MLDRAEILKVAVTAQVDERTVRRVLAGDHTRRVSIAAIIRALRELGHDNLADEVEAGHGHA